MKILPLKIRARARINSQFMGIEAPLWTAGFFIFTLTVSEVYWAQAAFNESARGTSSGQFLKLGVGARPMAMGEAFSAVAQDISALYWNPAALARIKGFSTLFMHQSLYSDIPYDYLGFGQNLGPFGSLGTGIQYLSIPAIEETDTAGKPTGENFRPRDTAVSLGYAYAFGSKSSDKGGAGVSGKWIQSKIQNSASTFAADIGLLSPSWSRAKTSLRAALVGQNLGKGLKFDRAPDPLPLNLKLAGALTIGETWVIAMDGNLPRDNRSYAGLGTEYRLNLASDWNFFGRVGFNTKTLADNGPADGLQGLSSGVGLRFGSFNLDYAFVPGAAIGASHIFSLSAVF